MVWRVLPNIHDGSCGFRTAAQLLGWNGNQYKNMMRLRRECADDVRHLCTEEELAFAAYTYTAAYDEPGTRHEVEWMAPFVGKEMSKRMINKRFREAFAKAIETPGDVFWSDHFALELISNRYKILFLTVRSSTNKITIMPSRFSQTFDGDLEGVRIGFILHTGDIAFDAICYKPDATDKCIASITQTDLDDNAELAKIVYAVLSRSKQRQRGITKPDVRFPMSISKLLAQPRFKPLRTDHDPSLNDLSTRMAAIDIYSPHTRKKMILENDSATVNRVRNPETKRCIIVNGPTWREHLAMYGDRVFTYEIC